MAQVQAVNGFTWATNRSVARPYGYGRGMMLTDPAYSPYLANTFHPVTLSYVGNTVRTDDYVWGMTPEEREAYEQQRPDYTPSQSKSALQNNDLGQVLGVGGGGRDDAAARRIVNQKKQNERAGGNPEATVTAVQNPQAGGVSDREKERGRNLQAASQRAAGNTEMDRIRGHADPFAPAGAAGAAGAGTKAGLDGIIPWGGTTKGGGGAGTAAGITNLPPGVTAKSPWAPKGSYLIEAADMERVRDVAVQQYLSKNNEWAKGKGVPLGIGGESKYKGITKTDALAAMVQVIATPWTGPRPTVPSDIPRGSPAWDRAARGELVEYKAYTPAFTIRSANNAYYDLGLNRNTPSMQGEITNWKRAFNALGLYEEDSYPNLGSLDWGKYENDAMVKFMEIANSNPQAAQSAADLPNVRDSLLDYAAKQGQAGGGGGGTSGPSYPFTQTQTTTSVQLSNLEDARETLRGYITNMIGRHPSDGEVRQFLGKMNDYERAHPSKTTTTSTYKDENTIVQNVTGDRGDNIDPFNIVQEYAKQQTPGDYHAYQQLKYYQGISDIISNPNATKTIPEES